MSERTPGPQISIAYLLDGRWGGDVFVILWYITAPLVLLRPFVRVWQRFKK